MSSNRSFKNQSTITPGNAGNSYVTAFDDMQRHLEEVTSQGKIWPIKDGKGNDVQWHRYQDTEIHDIAISPLQKGFKFSLFADSLLKNKTKWENLSIPPHDVLVNGALAVKRQNGQIDIIEGDALRIYLEGSQNINNDVPLFFCDKAVGKVKPLGRTTLSEIYSSLAKIKDFEVDGTEVIVATCSPTSKTYDDILVLSKQPATEFANVNFVNISSNSSSKPVKEAYVLVDPTGNNFVDSVEEKNGSYIIKGRNSAGVSRSITIDKDGNATGFQGVKNLGIVGEQMYKQKDAIFKHFGIPLQKAMNELQMPEASMLKKESKNAAQDSPDIKDSSAEVPQVEQALKEQQKLESLKKALKEPQRELINLLEQLGAKKDELIQKAKKDPKYTGVAGAVDKLYQTMKNEQNKFFANPTRKSFETCSQNIKMSISEAEAKAKEHRGWHQVDPIIRGIIGVLAALTVIPALIVESKSKHGFIQTFFAKPETDTTQKINDLKKQLEDQKKIIGEAIDGNNTPPKPGSF